MPHGRAASGLGAIGLIVSAVVVAGCGPDTAPLDRDGGVVAAPATTTDDAGSKAIKTPAPRSGSPSVLAETATPAPAPSPNPSAAVPSTPASTPAPAPPEPSEPEPSPLPVPLPAPLIPEVLVPDAVSINAARVVVNQSNVAVNTGGSSSSSARSIVESDAAVLVVQGSSTGIEVVSLEVRPGWVEAARSQTPDRLTLRYVLGTAAVDISVWASGSGLASSVSSTVER